MSDAPSPAATDANGIHRGRLFAGICLALVPTGASFALIANVLGQLKGEFILTNAAVGFIAGSFVWGMAISLLVLGPLLEGYGMKKGTAAAFIGHVTGVILLLLAFPFAATPLGFWLLTLGAVAMAIGHGMIEVAGNPLTAALYPENKTTKLNWFHAFFPIGILAGSLTAYCLNMLEGTALHFMYHWTFQVAIIMIPVIIYGIMVLPQRFPPTENTAAGLPVADMFRFTFTSPLMYVLLIMMAIAISIELGAMRWIPEVFGRVGIQEAILLMSWISLIMVVLRLYAAWFVEKFTPPGLLMGGGLSMALGMLIFGLATGHLTAFLGATFFGLGVAFFFPTTVGIVSERLPKTGSLGIVLTCGVGLLAAGAIGTTAIGFIGDVQLSNYLDRESRTETVAVLEEVRETFPEYVQRFEAASEAEQAELGYVGADVARAVRYAGEALAAYQAAGQQIRGNDIPQALRAIGEAGIPDNALIAQAGQLLGPAEGYGGQRALLLIAWLPLILFVFYGGMFVIDRARGGYKAIRLEHAMAAGGEREVPHEGAVPPEYDQLTVPHGSREGQNRGEGESGEPPRPQA